ncbi:MAG: hypothetical protein AAF639_10450 [Chloroflexota bacterium]
MSWLTELQQLPEGVAETTELLSQLDQCFLTGFARLGQSHLDSLAALERIYAGTPLAEPLRESIAALTRSEFLEQHFCMLAAARASLQGAQYTTLQRHLHTALGRTPAAHTDAPDSTSAEPTSWHDSTRHWLMELALAGFGQLETSTIEPFKTTLSQLQTEPSQFAQSTLLTNFVNELLRTSIANPEDVPLYRWVDLWTRAMIGTMHESPTLASKLVSGTLYPLGVDLRQHAFTASVVVYAMLVQGDDVQGDDVQTVRITLSTYKVDAIRGDELWLMFPQIEPLLNGLATSKSVNVTDVPLLPSGDLLWPDADNMAGVSTGKTYNLLTEAASWFAADADDATCFDAITPIDRHPIHVAELIFLQDYKVVDGVVTMGDDTLSIAREHLPALSDLTDAEIKKSNRMVGLLRFDGNQWWVQPLLVAKQSGKTKPKPVFIGLKGLKLLQKPPKSSVVETLTERASRLLRG